MSCTHPFMLLILAISLAWLPFDTARGQKTDSTESTQTSATEQAVKPTFRGTATMKGLRLRVRGPAERVYGDQTKDYGAEFFRDDDAGLLIVANDHGGISSIERPRHALVATALRDRAYLIRYDTYTGRTWSLPNGTQWQDVRDADPIPQGFYEVTITGPFVEGGKLNITRIERNTGRTWYAIDNVWKLLQEPAGEAASK